MIQATEPCSELPDYEKTLIVLELTGNWFSRRKCADRLTNSAKTGRLILCFYWRK